MDLNPASFLSIVVQLQVASPADRRSRKGWKRVRAEKWVKSTGSLLAPTVSTGTARCFGFFAFDEQGVEHRSDVLDDAAPELRQQH